MKIDRSMLPAGVSFERKEGPFAQLGPQQQVLHLGFYVQGRLKPGTWSLDIAPDGSWARAQREEVMAWIPKPGEEGASLEAFAREWIARITRKGEHLPLSLDVCSFCGKNRQEVKQIILGPVTVCGFCRNKQHEVNGLSTGPVVTICNECVALCSDIIASDTRSDG